MSRAKAAAQSLRLPGLFGAELFLSLALTLACLMQLLS